MSINDPKDKEAENPAAETAGGVVLPPIAGEWQSRLHPPKETVIVPTAADGTPPTLLVKPGLRLESLQFETRSLRATEKGAVIIGVTIAIFAHFKWIWGRPSKLSIFWAVPAKG